MSATLAARGLLSVEATAESMDLSKPTVYRMIRTGQLPAVRHGGRSWVAQADIEDYFARLRAEGAKRARALRLATKSKRAATGGGRARGAQLASDSGIRTGSGCLHDPQG